MIKKSSLLWPMFLLVSLPLVAAWFAYPQTHIPPGFGIFPPLFVAEPPGFNLLVFILIALLELAVGLFLLFPQWFGFKPVSVPAAAARVKLPVWFWIGLLLTGFFWWLMWARETPFGDLVYYAFTPMWWGFILLLDGIVYSRSNGYSLLASRPKTFVISAVVSVFGWYLFEYLNYFALSNWYYPNSTMPELSHGMIVALFLLAYTTVWPAIFEWYALLNTCPKLASRYSNGPRLVLSGNLLMWLGLLMMVAMVFYPYPLFWAMWVGTLLVVSGTLQRLGIEGPFSELAKGNWGPMILMALSSLLNGFFWEVWNYGSAHPSAVPATNPNYWIYDIPYVNVIHIYAEMPLLGFAGYLPFGIMVWVVFIWAGKLLGFDTRLLKDK